MRKKFLVFPIIIACTTQLFSQKQEGSASYYHHRFHGRKTASGEPYRKELNTCAHRTYPFDTMLAVTNLKNGKQTIVKVNDRGPFHSKRMIDLSYAAAVEIDLIPSGVATVRIEVLPKFYNKPTPILPILNFNRSTFYKPLEYIPQELPYIKVPKAAKKKHRR